MNKYKLDFNFGISTIVILKLLIAKRLIELTSFGLINCFSILHKFLNLKIMRRHNKKKQEINIKVIFLIKILKLTIVPFGEKISLM